MANTRPVKIMIPGGQYDVIEEWVREGMYASVTTFCTAAVEKQIDYQRELAARQSKSDGKCIPHESERGRA